jgi:hypothetical protein
MRRRDTGSRPIGASTLKAAGLGQSTAVSIGGDAIIGQTYAELDKATKNGISHRFRALDKLRAQADAEGFAARLSAVEADLDDGLPPLAPGLALVTCIDFYAPAVMAQARELLAPGGMLLLQVLLQPPGGDSPHRSARGAALELAAGLRLLFYREGVIGGRALAQLLAQRDPAAPVTFSD